jgi:hypothetical protein
MIYGLYTMSPLGVVTHEQMYFEGRGVYESAKYGRRRGSSSNIKLCINKYFHNYKARLLFSLHDKTAGLHDVTPSKTPQTRDNRICHGRQVLFHTSDESHTHTTPTHLHTCCTMN